jgi:phospho-N-acetylmuramoyl-pentapeptide-transferase
MAPIHHHYELKGWKENQVVVASGSSPMAASSCSASTLKLR